MLKKYTIVAVLIWAAAAVHAQAERPGREQPPEVKTVIFNVSDKASSSAMARASITCRDGRRRYRKTTDTSGVAALTFRTPPRASGESASLSCIVQKRGYGPVHKALNLHRINTPHLVSLKLERQG